MMKLYKKDSVRFVGIVPFKSQVLLQSSREFITLLIAWLRAQIIQQQV